jgi:hypothetical protein
LAGSSTIQLQNEGNLARLENPIENPYEGNSLQTALLVIFGTNTPN